MATTTSSTDALAVLRRERARLERRAEECFRRAAREEASALALQEGLDAMRAVEIALTGEGAAEEAGGSPAPRSTPAPRPPKNKRGRATKRPRKGPGEGRSRPPAGGARPTPADAAPPQEGVIIHLGGGERDIGPGTNFGAIVDVLASRDGHWMTPTGILEVLRAKKGGRDLPQHMTAIIAQELAKQRKGPVFRVPGLQARQVDGRWQYRIAAAAAAEG